MESKKRAIDIQALPSTRKEQFSDILAHEFSTILKCGIALILFALPLLASLIFKELNFLSFANDANEIDQITLFKLLRRSNLIFDAVNIISFAVLFLGVAGVQKIIKEMIFGEKVFFMSKFFVGIKENFKQCLIISIFFSLSLLVFNLANITSSIDGNATYSVVAWIFIGVFLFVFMPIFLILLAMNSTYKNSFSQNVKNSFALLIKHFWPYILIPVVFAVLLLALYLANSYAQSIMVVIGVLILELFILFPILLIANYLFAYNLFDIYINKNYPEIYRKGLRKNKDEAI